jgi:hypothetical protein
MAKNRQSKKGSRRRGGKGRRRGRSQQIVMPFGRRNYQLIGLGLLIVAIGYIIMRVENEMDGFWSLYVSPLLLLIGYLGIVYAIIWRPKTEAAGEP